MKTDWVKVYGCTPEKETDIEKEKRREISILMCKRNGKTEAKKQHEEWKDWFVRVGGRRMSKWRVEVLVGKHEDNYAILDDKFSIVATNQRAGQLIKICDAHNKCFEEPTGTGETSDGFHTFNELYYQRMVLFITICNQNLDIAWKSKFHDDGTMFDNYFICGLTTPEGEYTYHYHMENWEHFKKVKELPNAPAFDGHTEKDVVRLFSITMKGFM